MELRTQYSTKTLNNHTICLLTHAQEVGLPKPGKPISVVGHIRLMLITVRPQGTRPFGLPLDGGVCIHSGWSQECLQYTGELQSSCSCRSSSRHRGQSCCCRALAVCCSIANGVQGMCRVLVRESPARSARRVSAVCVLSAAVECVRVVVCLA